ncbi:polysaccharide deacetylase family protein [Fulvivirga sediminis]|uniref:Polysaccharide deacetylase family protein n=1 Tax=Fulvivirga sediminis TaxID=2803949 RepID=A0A937F911_9BACT|nr:polysaccharide deacetylase family protein [Fulvivirga sediminis]MBL3656834.1 polysaccharide deacetylase family protein [Fulvivirga sediminis]
MSKFQKLRIIFIVTLIILLACDYFLITISWWVYTLPLSLFIGCIAIGSSVMRYNFFVDSYNHTDAKENKIAITFDDGPTEYTQEILSLLEKYEAKASFFVIGRKVEEKPEVVKRISDAGHVIGNHSYSHHFFFSLFSKRRIASEIIKTKELIQSITGEPVCYFRPPYGVTNPAIAAAVNELAIPVIGWSIRSFDTRTSDAKKVAAKVISMIKPGSVILLHDSLPHAVSILEEILQYSKRKNYKCVTVDEVFKLR